MVVGKSGSEGLSFLFLSERFFLAHAKAALAIVEMNKTGVTGRF